MLSLFEGPIKLAARIRTAPAAVDGAIASPSNTVDNITDVTGSMYPSTEAVSALILRTEEYYTA